MQMLKPIGVSYKQAGDELTSAFDPSEGEFDAAKLSRLWLDFGFKPEAEVSGDL